MESIRGHSIGNRSLGFEFSTEYEPRSSVQFSCSQCDSAFSIVFAADAEIPRSWRCAKCGGTGLRHGLSADFAPPENDERTVGKSPFEMLLERRSREELETILDERLAYLRARRGTDEFDAQ